MENLEGDLFVGEAKLFFARIGRQWRLPFRIEAAETVDRHHQAASGGAVSLTVHVHNADLIMLCDSRMNPTRVAKELCLTDIGNESDVPAYDAENAGRWTNLRFTSDGRHWSDGEYHWKRMLDANRGLTEQCEQRPNPALCSLTAQLPPTAVEAVHDGRAIIVCRTKSIADLVKRRDGKESGLHVRRLCKSFGNQVYEVRITPSECYSDDLKCNSGESVVALLFVGKFWPKDVSHRPGMTVVRTRPLKGATTAGGRVFCICIGDYLRRILDGSSVEEIAKTKRHYEGYFDECDCNRFLQKNRSLVADKIK